MTQTFIVRPAQLRDLETLVSFTLAEAREAEGLEKPPHTITKGIQAALEDPGLARYWVLEDTQGQIVGSISVILEWSDWGAGFYWWIQSIFIQPAYRRQGMLKLLLDAVREVALQENALEIRLYVHQENTRAIKAYHREGFSVLPYQIMMLELDSPS